MRYIITILCLCLCMMTKSLLAQELNAKVIIQAPKLKLVSPKVFKTLENEIQAFLNQQKWTNDQFKQEERIECSFLISIIDELSPTSFQAKVTVQSNRPVFNSSYNTLLLNHQDKDWTFQYVEYEPLEFNDNAYLSELTSLLAFYAYLIIGLDYDTFAPLGGKANLVKAQEVVTQAQNSPSKGWKAFGSTRNRYWMVENLLDKKFEPMRRGLYEYHRKGLDMMYDKPDIARRSIIKSLGMVQGVHKNVPNSMGVNAFINAKGDEVINVFSDPKVPVSDKMKAFNAMVALDPANLQLYESINKKTGALPPGGIPGRGRGGK